MIYLLLASLWPVLNFFENNFLKLNNFLDVGIIAISCVTLCVSGSLIIKKITGKKPEDLLFFLLTSIMIMFNYSNTIELFSFTQKFHLKSTYLWIIFYLYILYKSYKYSNKDILVKISKIFILISVLVPIFNIAVDLFKNKSKQDTIFNTHLKNVGYNFSQKPNVYYILLDAYARQDTLKETLDYNNEDFLKSLEDIGFCTSKSAFSNYHFTIASLSATMNMTYHKKNKNNLTFVDEKSLTGFNDVRKIFAYNEYEIINIPSHWHQIGCAGNETICVPNNSFEVYESFLKPSILKSIISFKNNYIDISEITNFAKNKNKKSFFLFAHIAHVHDAIYTKEGKNFDNRHPIYSNKTNGENYKETIKLVNQQLLKAMNEIIKNDPYCIIILQADHGPSYVGLQKIKDPNYWLSNYKNLQIINPEEIKYTFGIFSAVYFSPSLKKTEKIKEYFSGKYSLINTFRVIFAFLSNKAPTLLPDTSHFLYDGDKLGNYKEQDISIYQK